MQSELFMGTDDSRVDPRHTATAAAVASFRTWRGSRPAVAQGPTIICTHKVSVFEVQADILHSILHAGLSKNSWLLWFSLF